MENPNNTAIVIRRFAENRFPSPAVYRREPQITPSCTSPSLPVFPPTTVAHPWCQAQPVLLLLLFTRAKIGEKNKKFTTRTTLVYYIIIILSERKKERKKKTAHTHTSENSYTANDPISTGPARAERSSCKR